MLDGLYNKYGKKKVYWTVAGFLMVLNIIILIVSYQNNIRFTIGHKDFKYLNDKDNTIYFEDSEENELVVRVDSSFNYYAPYIIGNNVEIEYKNAITKVDSSDYMNEGTIITLSDGRVYKESISNTGYRGDKIGYGPFEVKLARNIHITYKFIDSHQYYLIPFLTFPLILIGLALMFYTEKAWRFQYRFTVMGGEPTEWALFTNKVVGFFIVLFSFVILFTNL